nr:cationic peroxidase 1-like [Tanacetum cinerariifolium]
CAGVVSCADILAAAARDSVVALGGPGWNLVFGRRDSTTANANTANSNLPAPTLSLSGLISSFSNQNLNTNELVALSGAHTIGQARCTTFRSRLANDNNINATFLTATRANCPTSGGDNNLSPLDATPTSFDNRYYNDLINQRGLLHSDQELFNGGSTDALVRTYASNQATFFRDFASAMVKMSNLNPLTGSNESIDCLPNEEIFTELSRMGYEKPSTKLTFYKVFFSPQWKFLIHNILQCMSAKRTSWNEFSSFMASAVICLSIGMIVAQQADDVADEVSAGVDVDAVPAAAEPSIPSPTPTTQPPPPLQELPSTSQVIPTPPSSPIVEPSPPPQQQQTSQPTHDAEISLDLLHTLMETYTTLTRKVEALEKDKEAQALEIIQLKQRVKKLERKNRYYVKIEENADVQGRQAEFQAQIYKIDLEHADKVLSMQDDELKPSELKEVVEVVTTAKLMTEVVTAVSATITAATTPITAAPSTARRRKRV